MDAPQGSVSLEESNELERLRRRAYGPEADIAGDAAAQARLSELEAAHHRQPPPVVDTAGIRGPAPERAPGHERAPLPESVEGSSPYSTSVPQPVDGAFAEHAPARGSVTAQDLAEGSNPGSDAIDGVPAAPWWLRHRRLAILGGAIAALALIVAQVAGMSQLLTEESTLLPADTSTAKMPPVPDGFRQGLYLPPPDHMLALKSVGAAADRPNDHHGTLDALGISRDELTRYEDFQGPAVRDLHGIGLPLNVWSGESRSGMTCLFVAIPDQGIREGGAEGCSPEGLDTITELRHMRGDGFTRFLLRDDHINVYVYVRAPDPTASQG